MQYNVTIKTIPERYAACIHTTIPCYSEEGSVWKTLCEETDGCASSRMSRAIAP